MTSPNADARAPLQVSVVVPVCNEDENVVPLAREIHAALTGRYTFETIFVDDGSTDGTAEAVLAARGAGHARDPAAAARRALRAERGGRHGRACTRARRGSRRSTATDRTIRPTFRSLLDALKQLRDRRR